MPRNNNILSQRDARSMQLLRAVPYALLAACLGLIAGCGSASSSSTSTKAAAGLPKVITVRVANASFGTGFFPLDVMQSMGLDEKYGLNVVKVPSAFTPGENDRQLESNIVDVSIDSWTGLQQDAAKGINNIMAIGPNFPNTNRMVVQTSSPIHSPCQLKGKRIGLYAATGADILAIRVAIQKECGFDYFTSSIVVPLSAPLMNAELLKGQLDAIFTFSNLADQLVATGNGRVLFLANTLLHSALGLPLSSPFSVYITTRSELSNPVQREGLRRFMEAYNAAVHIMDTDSSVWPPLVQTQGFTNPTVITLFRQDEQKTGFTTLWNQAAIANMKTQFNLIKSLKGASDVLGTSTFDASLYSLAVYLSNS